LPRGPVAEQPLGEAEVGPKGLCHIRTAATDLDHCRQHITRLPAGAAELGRHPEAEHTGLPDRLDGLVLQYPPALGGGVVTTECGDDLG
jgi:hypothetical protein